MVTIESVEFKNVFLRMAGNGVTETSGPGGGTVNCQFGANSYEKFELIGQPDGTFAIASVEFKNVFLRMAGNGVTESSGPGGGTVNCQFGVGAYEKFYIVPQDEGTIAIASQAFPGVFLRMAGNGVTEQSGPGGGTVNCQFGVGGYEKFKITVL